MNNIIIKDITNFEASALRVFSGIETLTTYYKDLPVEQRKGVEGVYRELGEDIIYLHLGGNNSVRKFVGASEFEGFIKLNKEGIYELTKKGKEKLIELREGSFIYYGRKMLKKI